MADTLDVRELSSDEAIALRKRASRKFSRYFLLILLLAVTLLFLNMVKYFLVPVMLAAVFTSLFYPLFRVLLRATGGRKGLTAFFCCLILLLGLLGPIYMVANLVTKEAVDFYGTMEAKIDTLLQHGQEGFLGRLRHSEWSRRLGINDTDWQATFKDVATRVGGFLATAIKWTSQGALDIIVKIFVTLFIMFYFFRDGESLLNRLKILLPLTEQYEEAIITRFVRVSRATLKGTLLVGMTQSCLGAITLWIFGVDSPVLWFVVMFILSMIPIVGAWLVMHTAAVIQIILGNVWEAIGIFAITVVVISSIDNIMRPRLVGRDAGLHDLMIFFSTLGGLAMFGPMGVIVGPVIGALFVTVLEIYSLEFRSQLELARSRPKSGELPVIKTTKD